MRFLLTFLLLACIQSFVVCTKEDGTITIAQKTINNSTSNKDVAPLISKKENNEIIKNQSFNIIDRFQDHITNYNSLAINLIQHSNLYVFQPLHIVTYLKDNTNHSYQFIFGCLYPKHTFW